MREKPCSPQFLMVQVQLYHNNSVRVATTADGVDFSGTGSIKVPVGTTAERPTGVAGDFRYNSTTGGFEGYTTEWGAIAGSGGGSGITTTASAPSANTFVYLDLGAAQYHELALSAGITTISCSNGTVGDSHVVVINQPSSGIATVGFDTYFEFPSGATPAMSEGSSKVDMVSFVVKKDSLGQAEQNCSHPQASTISEGKINGKTSSTKHAHST